MANVGKQTLVLQSCGDTMVHVVAIGFDGPAGNFSLDFSGLLQTNGQAPSATQPLSLAKGAQATVVLAYKPTQAAPSDGAGSFVPETAHVLVHLVDPALPSANVTTSGFGVQ